MCQSLHILLAADWVRGYEVGYKLILELLPATYLLESAIHILEERERVSYLLDEKINCNNLSDRKDIMLQRSDLLVALPGGIGTLDEIFHILAAATIGYHNKRVVLYNVNGFWNGLVKVIDDMGKAGFIRSNLDNMLLVVET